MNEPPLESLEVLFERARSLPPDERAAFVSACSEDPDVRRELAGLLEVAEEAPSFFEALAKTLAPDGASVLDAPFGPSSGPDGATPREIGHYRIEELLGAGGMGVVYRAVDTRLGREVALKLLPHHLGRDAAARRRFLTEARAAAALDHPHVCALHEVGEDAEGRVYIAMGYYGGETLDRVLERGPLPVDRALRTAREIGSALEAAHERGIVHRDIKPGNVLITDAGTVKLLDFGLAKLGNATLTEAGRRLGTVAYMSPEQTRSGGVGTGTDLWSLGVVLYELLTGERPFQAGNAAATIEAIREARPTPPSALRGDLPAGLDALVLGLLSSDPDARREPFRALLGGEDGRGEGTAAAPAGRRSRTAADGGPRSSWRRVALAAGTAAAVAALAVLLRGGFGGAETPSVRRLAVLPLADSTGDPAQHYVVEGLHQAMIEDLTRTGAVAVTSPAAAERYRGSDRSPVRIAAELGVDAVVEGTVRKSGDSLRLHMRLLRGASGTEAWSATFVGSARAEILALPSRVSAGIAEAAGGERTGPALPEVTTASGRDPRAERAFLRGLYELRRFKNMDLGIEVEAPEAGRHLREAIAALETAVTLEPEWAAAHARLALTYHWLASTPLGSDTSHYWDLSRAEALRSVGLDESEAQGFASLGFVLYFHEHEWARAERAIRRALELEPSSDNHWIYALYLMHMARYSESIEHFEEAEKRDPLSPVLRWQHLYVYSCAGRYEEAIVWMRQQFETEIAAGREDALLSLAYLYSRAGRHREAAALLEQAIAVSDSAAVDVAALALVRARAGETGRARALLRRLDESSPGWDLTAFDAPAALAAVGQRERAVTLYRQRFERSPREFLNMRCGWGYPYLKDDPRVREIERSMRFPAAPASTPETPVPG